MSTLVIDQRGTQLSQQAGALMLRTEEAPPKSVPLRMLDRVVVAGSAHIDSSLLTHLAEQDIGVLILPARGHRRSAFLHGHSHGDAARRLGQYRLVTDDVQALRLSRRFVCLRMLGAHRLLKHALNERPDRRRPLLHSTQRLQRALAQTKTADSIDRLRGIEGAAAAAFFSGYTTLFADDLNFTGRNRRPPKDPVNACLSLAYTMAHGDAIQALVRAGLDPMLGFLHSPNHNRESLACDLVEIARPRVERLTWRLFRDRQLRSDCFSIDNGAARLGKSARQTFFAAYESHAHTHRRWFRRYTESLAKTCTAAQENHR